jgi:ABC-type antimicrobial peptide transport system permease subunit
MLVALFFMLLTFVFACMIPAVKAVKMDVNAVLRDGTRGALGRGAGRTSTILVTVQVTLIAILMLAGSLGVALMFKMVNLLDDLPQQNRFGAEFVIDSVEPEALVNDLMSKVGALPQIREVGLMQPTMPGNIRLSSGPLDAQVDVFLSGGNIGLFNTNVTKGREIDSRDDGNNERVAMVSQSFVQRHWPTMNPIGQIIDIELNGLFTPHVVVGVVEDQIGNSQAVFAQKHEYDEIYISFFQSPVNQFEFTFVTTDEVERAKEAFFSVLYQLDAKSMLVDFEDREGAVNSVMKVTKLITYIVLYSGLFALFLALMGVFGVAASAVALRRQEVGVRRAIGAKDKAIIALFLKRNMKPLGIGLAVGLVVYTLICYLFSTMVGNRIEMGTYISIAVITSLLLSLILCLAAYFPTRAAIAKEPFETLRAD